MQSQPDFQKIFADWGASVIPPLQFTVRIGCNLSHDVAFLSSLIHDARIRSMTVTGNELQISLLRDTWETYPSTRDLNEVESELQTGPLKAVRFTNCENRPVGSGDMIEGVRSIPDPTRGGFIIQVFGQKFSIEVELDEFDFSVQLRDAVGA